MSDGTPGPATWPRCRGPLAYGHATATRIFCDCDRVRSFGRLGGARDHTNRLRHGRADKCEQDDEEDERPERMPVPRMDRRRGVRGNAHRGLRTTGARPARARVTWHRAK